MIIAQQKIATRQKLAEMLEVDVQEVMKEPYATLDFSGGYIDYTVNAFHFLDQYLDFEEELDHRFHEVFMPAHEEVYGEGSWDDLIAAFPQWLIGPNSIHRATGIYNDGDPMRINTYDEESGGNLSRTLQYTYFTVPDEVEHLGREEYFLLQISYGSAWSINHTEPHVFVSNGNSDLGILGLTTDGAIWCEGREIEVQCCNKCGRKFDLQDIGQTEHCPACGSTYVEHERIEHRRHHWYTDDSVHWRDEYGEGVKNELQEYGCEELEEDQEPEPGKLFYDEDGNGFCPECCMPLCAA